MLFISCARNQLVKEVKMIGFEKNAFNDSMHLVIKKVIN